MHRRLLLCSTLCIATWLTACSFAPRSYTLSQTELQTIAAKSFPRNYPLLGLVKVDVFAPTLQLKPERNRINATMTAQLTGKVLPRSYDGALDLDFALRYEPKDHTLRATQLEVNSFMMTGLPDGIVEMVNAYASRAAAQAMDDVVIHTLRDEDLAKLEKVGRQPATFTVTKDGLRIDFVEPGK